MEIIEIKLFLMITYTKLYFYITLVLRYCDQVLRSQHQFKKEVEGENVFFVF